MSDFWQASDTDVAGLLAVNLDHVVSVDRLTEGRLRITTVVPGLTYILQPGSTDQGSFLKAIGERIGSGGQLIAQLGDIRDG